MILRKGTRDERGVTAVEFALILPVMLLMIMGFIEMGFEMMVSSKVSGVLAQAARMTTTGTMSGGTIDSFVKTQLENLYPGSKADISKKSYAAFTGVGTPEPITSDTVPTGKYNKGDCYQDVNNNGRWDADQGASGTGGPDDVLYYEVTYRYPRLFPYVSTVLGWPSMASVSANSTMRNEPFGVVSSTGIKVLCS